MQIEIGKYYQMRDGRQVGPVRLLSEDDPSLGFKVDGTIDAYLPTWTEDGACDFFLFEDENAEHSEYDLVAEVENEEYSAQMAWADIAAMFDRDTVRRWARFAAAIVKEMPVETEEDRRQIAAYNKLLRGLDHIIAEQDKTQ